MDDYLNQKFVEVIREHIHHERNREIMFLHFVQGKTYEWLAGEFKLSPRQISRICTKNLAKISDYLKET